MASKQLQQQRRQQARRHRRLSVIPTMTPLFMWSLLLFFLSTSFLIIQPVSGYASWLRCFVDLDETEVIMNQKVIHSKHAQHFVTLQLQNANNKEMIATTTSSSPNKAIIGTEAMALSIQLNVPEELKELDIQFVIETSNVQDSKFIKPEMCDGRRSFARNYDEAVELSIEAGSDSITLWAGYAAGFEAVTLTPKLELERQPSSTTDNDGNEL